MPINQSFDLSTIAATAVLLLSALAEAQPYLPSEQPRPMALKTLDLGRAFNRATSATVNPAPKVKRPAILSKADWGGGESSGTMRSQFPSSLTVHHEGSPKPLTPDKDPKILLQNLQKYGWNHKNWPDLPYHFLVDLAGNIYEGRDPLSVGDTNTSYDPAGKLLVTAMGNTEVQAPPEKQLNAMCDLMAWASDYYNIPPETIRGHMEYTGTACPGKYLYPYVASGFFEGEVRRRISDAYNSEQTSVTVAAVH